MKFCNILILLSLVLTLTKAASISSIQKPSDSTVDILKSINDATKNGNNALVDTMLRYAGTYDQTMKDGLGEAILSASKTNNAAIMDALLKFVRENKKDVLEYIGYAIGFATEKRNNAMVETLISYAGSYDQTMKNGLHTAFSSAAKTNNAAVIDSLFKFIGEHKSDFLKQIGFVINYVSENGNNAIFGTLLRYASSYDQTMKDGIGRAIRSASKTNNAKILKALLEFVGEHKNDVLPPIGQAIGFAIKNSNSEMIQILLNYAGSYDKRMEAGFFFAFQKAIEIDSVEYLQQLLSFFGDKLKNFTYFPSKTLSFAFQSQKSNTTRFILSFMKEKERDLNIDLRSIIEETIARNDLFALSHICLVFDKDCSIYNGISFESLSTQILAILLNHFPDVVDPILKFRPNFELISAIYLVLISGLSIDIEAFKRAIDNPTEHESNLVERISNYTEAEVEELQDLFKKITQKCTPYFGTDHDDIKCGSCLECNVDLDEDEMTKAERTIVSMKCNSGHNFHLKCISAWFIDNNRCPICSHQF